MVFFSASWASFETMVLMQGLHSSVREARKSVARELICLQEKLDTLCKQPSGEFDHTNSNEKSERVENINQTVAPTITTGAGDKVTIRLYNSALRPYFAIVVRQIALIY